MTYVFLLTYNEQLLWWKFYPTKFVEEHFKSNNIKFIVLDNGNQPLMKHWCKIHDMIYYASEYNIGSAGGYNWIFKVAQKMGIDHAVLMQADVEMDNATPLILTNDFAKNYGSTAFGCWPQEMWGFWDSTKVLKPFDHALVNLGNLVGFNPQAMHEKDCYFDDNYVVTHFDDLEFMQYLDNTKKFNCINIAHLLNFRSQFYSSDKIYATDNISTLPNKNTFNIKTDSFHLKIHHASANIDATLHNKVDSHTKWYNFNKPYYDQVFNQEKGIYGRLPYDPSRWTQFGYPPYPTQYEINRFFNQYPELLKVES